MALVTAAGTLLAACGKGAAPQPRPSEAPASAEAVAAEPSPSAGRALSEGPEWGYAGDSGPESWGELRPEFAACSSGRSQSPIDLPTDPAASELGSILFDYKPSRMTLLNNRRTIQVDYEPGSSVTLDGAPYQLQQFHFHVPGEHLVGGSQYPMEVHLVHSSSEGSLLVLAGLFYGGVINKPMVMASAAHNPALDLVWQNIPPSGERIQSRDTISAENLLPVDRRYVTYEGSLTTPPCAEGVRWIVLTTPMVVASAHVQKFLSIIGPNARPVQELNGRRVGGGYIQPPEPPAS